MKVTDLISLAQQIAGIGVIEGTTIDINQMASTLAIFHQTVSSINNDPRLTFWQKTINYATYKQEIPENITDIYEIERIKETWLFPEETVTPFAIAATYSLPKDFHMAISCFSQQTELRKTNYSTVIGNRMSGGGMLMMYAINGRAIELVRPGYPILLYSHRMPDFMPQEELDIPANALDYVINLLAKNLAMTDNKEAVERCTNLAKNSYNQLIANQAIDQGESYLNQYVSMNRFRYRSGPMI